MPPLWRRSLHNSVFFSRRVFYVSIRTLKSVESLSNPSKTPTTANSWRREQLSKLEAKHLDRTTANSTKEQQQHHEVSNEEDLQQHWKDMESRVTRRRVIPLDRPNVKVGRQNVRTTDEDLWLAEGLYDDNKIKSNEKGEDGANQK